VQGGAFAGGSEFNLHTTSHHDKRPPPPAKLHIGEQTPRTLANARLKPLLVCAREMLRRRIAGPRWLN